MSEQQPAQESPSASAEVRPSTDEQTPPAKGGLLSRRNVVLLGLAGGLLALLGVTRTWITVEPPSSSVDLASISVSGTDAAAAVMALTVVGIACAVATTISGKIARYIVAAVQLLVGVGIVGFIFPVLADPATAASAKVGKAYGLSTVDSLYHVSLWPWVSFAGGIVLMLGAVALALGSASWHNGRRYERTASGRAVVTDTTMDDIDRWDALTEGDDPTDGEDGIRGARFH